LHAAQFQRRWITGHLGGCGRELFRRFQFGFGLDNTRAFLSDRFSLHGHHLLHGFG